MPGIALIFDTETTGLFQFKDEDGNSVPADADGQPRLLSIATALVNQDGTILDQFYDLVKPEGFEVDEAGEAFAVNKLSNDILSEKGKPVVDVLEMYDIFLDKCDFVSAFGIGFDQKMVRAEMRRAGRDDRYGYRSTFEIMYKARSLACEAGAPHSNPKKLTECFENIMECSFPDAHDAHADLHATIDIYRQLLFSGKVEPKEQVSKKKE
ncbi:MAG: 3'-5' exonuclease [Ketobacter sp.]|nr:3'-5' exonuclease [Ketobacter sp.]